MKKRDDLLIIIPIILLIILLILIFTNNIRIIDNFVYDNIIKLKSDTMTNTCKFISNLCNTYFVIFVAALTLLIKNKRYPKLIISNLALATLINQTLKRVIRRKRPNILRLVKESGYSFPSGHSMVSFCFYGLIIYLISKSNFKYKKIYMSTLSILIFLIGMSRIYLGVHYFSDVIGAWLVGMVYIYLFIKYSEN